MSSNKNKGKDKGKGIQKAEDYQLEVPIKILNHNQYRGIQTSYQTNHWHCILCLTYWTSFSHQLQNHTISRHSQTTYPRKSKIEKLDQRVHKIVIKTYKLVQEKLWKMILIICNKIREGRKKGEWEGVFERTREKAWENTRNC